jgi:crossover junction endodeoxyribonuclease RuvC
MMRILGVDPGLQHTGWGMISSHHNQLGFIACGVIHTDPKLPTAERLKQIYEGLQQVIALHAPQEGAV